MGDGECVCECCYMMFCVSCVFDVWCVVCDVGGGVCVW